LIVHAATTHQTGWFLCCHWLLLNFLFL